MSFFSRLLRAFKLLARDERIPKPIRLLAGIGLLPIPGPFDEAVLILISPCFLIYRKPLREAWQHSAETPAEQ